MTSTTVLTDSQVKAFTEKYNVKPWIKKDGEARYYLNRSELEKIIGLKEEYYNSGRVSHCSYTDESGRKVKVANGRAYNSYLHKIYIANGVVNSTWEPYDENIAELIAKNLTK